MEEKEIKKLKKKLSKTNKISGIALSVLLCLWIIGCIFWGIDMCKKEENKQTEMTVPVRMSYHGIDTTIRCKVVSFKDSTVVFDSLGIKIVGYNIE